MYEFLFETTSWKIKEFNTRSKYLLKRKYPDIHEISNSSKVSKDKSFRRHLASVRRQTLTINSSSMNKLVRSWTYRSEHSNSNTYILPNPTHPVQNTISNINFELKSQNYTHTHLSIYNTQQSIFHRPLFFLSQIYTYMCDKGQI